MTSLQRLFAVADDANGIGSKLDITKMDVSQYRPGGACAPDPRRRMDRHPRGNQLRARRDRYNDRHVGGIQQSVLVRRRPG